MGVRRYLSGDVMDAPWWWLVLVLAMIVGLYLLPGEDDE